MRHRLLLVFVTLLVAIGTVVGGAGLAQTQAAVSIEADSADPGTFTTHTVVVVIDENTTSDVRGLRIDYGDADVDTGEIDDNRIEEFGIDRDGDEPGDTVDVKLDDDIADIDSSDDGRVLELTVQGGRAARVGDEVVLSYRIDNPTEAGTYPVTVTYNPDGVAATGTATLQIGEPQTAAPTPVPTAQPTASPTPTDTPPTTTVEPTPEPTSAPTTATAEPTPEPTPAPTTAPETTTTTSPGFGVAVGVVAVVAAATAVWMHERR